MLGKIVLVIYVLIQTGISILTEYVIQKNRLYKNIGKKTRVLRIVIYTLLALIPVLGAFLPKSGFKFFCMGFGNVWLGFFMFYSTFVILSAIITHIVCRVSKDKEMKALGHAINVAFVLGLIFTSYGLVHAQNPKVVNYDIFPSYIKSSKRMTYAKVNDIIVRDIVDPLYDPFVDTLKKMNELHKIIR